MTAFKFRILLFAVTIFIITISNAFSDGKAHVEGQFKFPFPSKKTIQNTKIWSGMVVGVSDGDTITVMRDGKGEKIRLYGIDAPEGGQAFSNGAKRFTSEMVYGKTVEVETKGTDPYGHIVGMVNVDGQCLNEALIKNGFAWVYRKYCIEAFCEDWLNLEILARYGKTGLWSDPDPTPPWEYRKGKAIMD